MPRDEAYEQELEALVDATKARVKAGDRNAFIKPKRTRAKADAFKPGTAKASMIAWLRREGGL